MMLNYVLLYVENVPRSRDFYVRLLDLRPVEESGNFVLFVLPSGVKFGLWASHAIKPSASAPGGCELGIPVESRADVDRLASEWHQQGIEIIQRPEDMDFGRTFTAFDPDGHRLRVLHLDIGQ
ncbi:VOC family protein [Rhizobium sp. KVB221]|uniref:VOC family protein n=1 Tax=Rhizobium setariae TaxID=2801340 RepID=A0A936YMI4_9HYPH|nr:VOC family protein [Rhizobium setariae]MBL0372243.1 VOC family protein [Rhizobium setariae]